MKQNLLSLVILLLVNKTVFMQELPAAAEQQLESIANANESGPEDDAFFQEADHYHRHRLNLNNADVAELRSLRLLSDLQIENLLTYRRIFGNLVHIYEMQAIPAWDIATIRTLLPFVRVVSTSTLRENLAARLRGGDHMLLVRASRVVEPSKGFTRDSIGKAYLGSPLRLMFRYRYNYKNLLQYGLLGEKDAGEQFLNGAQRFGFDFYSFHLFLRKIGAFEAIAIGDFTVNLGQGLIHWQGLAFGKSGEVSNTKRQSPLLKPYHSPGEFLFHRGVGATLKIKRIEATVFASSRRLNANLAGETPEGEESLSSFLTSGYNRTVSELADRHSVRQFTAGGNVRFRKERGSFLGGSWHLGLNAVFYRLSSPLHKRQLPYNLYAIRGDSWSNASMDYSFTWRNIHLFGEIAMDRRRNFATLNGALISLDHRADLSLQVRAIPPQYQSLYGNAFTAGTTPTNEYGFFVGLTVRPSAAWRINVFADIFSFPWLRFRVDAPSSGSDFQVQLTCNPNRQLEWYMRFASGNNIINSSNHAGSTNRIVSSGKKNWRTHFSYKMNADLTIRGRVEASWFRREEEPTHSGLLGYFDLHLKPLMKPWGLVCRIQYFDVDSYDARLYAYENDVLYGSSIPAFSGKGTRYYFILNYDISKKLTTWIKWAQSVYDDLNIVGSGLDAIKGNKKSEIKIQARVLF